MNPGSEPERDDTGLPPVDVEIPDDARELDRDVQAYYREVRAQRRRSRSSRLRRSFARDGIVLPLLACCLIFALITGTLLTVFSAGDINQQGLGVAGGSAPTGSAAAPARPPAGLVVHQGLPLPHGTIFDQAAQAPLQQLKGAVLLLVPVNCNCAATLAGFASALAGSGVPVLLVASNGVPVSELSPAIHLGAPETSTNPASVLQARYREPGLTVVTVAADGSVQYAGQVRQDDVTYLLKSAGM